MRRLLCILVLAGLFLTFAIPLGAYYEAGTGFRCSDWALDYVYEASQRRGILRGDIRHSDITQPITRAEFFDMLFRVVRFGGLWVQDISMGDPAPFSDTDRLSVYCLAKEGLVDAVEGDRFMPEAFLTREQAAVYMTWAADFLSFTYLPETHEPFADADTISPWAVSAVTEMQRAGLMLGTDTGEFRPGDALTREEAMVMMMRFYEKNGFNGSIMTYNKDKHLTLEDFSDFYARYRKIGTDAYEMTFTSSSHRIVVEVVGDAIVRADCTFLGWYYEPGVTIDLRTKDMREDSPPPAKSNYQYQMVGGEKVTWEIAEDYRTTDFYNMDTGAFLFQLEGVFSTITHRVIITEATGYSFPSVDAAYTVYAVYALDGTQLEAMGLRRDELYEKGYLDR